MNHGYIDNCLAEPQTDIDEKTLGYLVRSITSSSCEFVDSLKFGKLLLALIKQYNKQVGSRLLDCDRLVHNKFGYVQNPAAYLRQTAFYMLRRVPYFKSTFSNIKFTCILFSIDKCSSFDIKTIRCHINYSISEPSSCYLGESPFLMCFCLCLLDLSMLFMQHPCPQWNVANYACLYDFWIWHLMSRDSPIILICI